MRIGISLNEVLRDFIGQVAYTHDKYLGEFDIEESPITDFDLLKHPILKKSFKDERELNKFMYNDHPLEIFGHNDQTHDTISVKLNKFLLDIDDEEEHEVEIVSREINKSIGATFFFLSKTIMNCSRLRFITSHVDEWDGVDVLITANPIALKNKPKGKIAVKVNAPYNEKSKADYTIDNLMEFMEDEDFRDEILESNTVNN